MTHGPNNTAPESSHKRVELLKTVSRFPSLSAAGRELGLRLEAYRNVADSVVLGIALGGLPVAREVAMHLGAPFDLIIIRRLLTPDGPGSQICAVNIGGSTILDEEISLSTRPSTPLEHFISDSLAELSQREQSCRRGRPRIDLAGRIIILVDCGIRSGSTMKAAIKALRTMEPACIVAAVPVASPEGYALVTDLVDEVVCLAQPRSFGHAGLWYEDFSRPDDDHVGELLEPFESE